MQSSTTETTMCGQEHTRTTTTTRTTVYSAPDSLGRQYPETVTESVTETDTERSKDGQTTRQENTQVNIEATQNMQVEEDMNFSTSDEERLTEQKKGTAWWVIYAIGITLVLILVIALIIYKR